MVYGEEFCFEDVGFDIDKILVGIIVDGIIDEGGEFEVDLKNFGMELDYVVFL